VSDVRRERAGNGSLFFLGDAALENGLSTPAGKKSPNFWHASPASDLTPFKIGLQAKYQV
jgi:hypothetical protein